MGRDPDFPWMKEIARTTGGPLIFSFAQRRNQPEYYRDVLEKAGMTLSGTSPDGLLPETIELEDHPWFIGVQFHPELKSKPFEPHPLFKSFVAAALDQSRLV